MPTYLYHRNDRLPGYDLVVLKKPTDSRSRCVGWPVYMSERVPVGWTMEGSSGASLIQDLDRLDIVRHSGYHNGPLPVAPGARIWGEHDKWPMPPSFDYEHY